MTTIFPDINDETYIIISSTYNIKNQSYKIDTQKLETWEKTTFSCPPESKKIASEKIFSRTVLQRRL